jgi:carbonic anhydrase
MQLRTRHAVIGAAALLTLVAGCSSDESTATTDAPTTTAHEHAHWTYEGEEGPEHWGELDPDYATCADGSAQTPIDIVDATSTDLTDPVLSYTAGAAKVTNNGHTIVASAAEGNSLSVDGKDFPLVQIHFHAGSEHTINGEQFPAEVHFVHKKAEGELAVLGVMITEGAENAAWAPFTGAMGTAKDAEAEIQLDWAAMLPTSKMTYRYTGSLTTPPCTEGVHWMLLETPVELSADQIAAMKAAYDGNFRPVQPLNGREVQMDSSEG